MFFNGRELSYTEIVCNGMMSVRFLRPVRQGQAVLLVVPGGPALSSSYLDGFFRYVGETLTGFNIGVVDFPNHGTGVLPKDKLPLIYRECLDLFAWAIRDVKKRTSSRMVLMGHSLGCRILVDLIAEDRVNALSALLLDPLFHDYEEAKDLTAFWKLQVLKFATTETGKGEFRELVTKMRWEKHEELFSKLKPLKDTLKKITDADALFPIAVVEGEWDPYRMSQSCRSVVEALFKKGGYAQVPASTHFAALERPEVVLGYLKQVCVALILATSREDLSR